MEEKKIKKLKANYHKKYTAFILTTLSTMLFIVLNAKQGWFMLGIHNWILFPIAFVCVVGICFTIFYSIRLKEMDLYEYMNEKQEEIEET